MTENAPIRDLNIQDLGVMLKLQGDKVLLTTNEIGAPNMLMTIIHLVDVHSRQLVLVNREGNKEAWVLTQPLADRMTPLKDHKEARWKLIL